MKSVHIKTFGCQMNIRDSEVVCGLLKKQGYKITDSPDKAGIILFNTCSVRQHAEDKVWSEIGRYKTEGPALSRRANQAGRKIIGLVGCMAQNYKERIFQRAPNVDFVVGTSDIHKIPVILKSLSAKNLFERKIWETDGESRPEEIYHTGFYEDNKHAYVVISEGCSNFCSYCVVPFVRGAFRSRNYKDVLKEIKEAIDKGIHKFTLLGQNVNAYKYDEVDFVTLVKLVNSVKGLKEFSFVTSHPKDTSPDLFKAMAESEKLKKCLHLPVQSGSDRILKLMNRNYTRKSYLDLAENFRKIVKDGVLTTDIIVGFPSETNKDFRATHNLVEKVKFNSAFIFKYSLRPFTEAASMPDDVPREEKEKRHSLILELQKKVSKKILILFLALGIFTHAYALNLDKVKVSFLSCDYKSAILEGEKILAGTKEYAPGLDELYYILGLSYLKEGNFLRASDIFEIILKEFRSSRFKDEAMLGLADSYFLRDDFVKAEKYCKDLLKANPHTKFKAQAYYRLSEIGFKKGDTAQGKEYLEKIESDFPANTELKMNKDLSAIAGSASGFYYTIQVGSFTKPNNARALRDKLAKKGYAAYLEEVDLADKKIYRVKVGKFKLRPEAIQAENKLSSEGYPTKIYP